VTHLLLTVRFVDTRYHGLLDRGGPPEWPPSPFRLFQALVAGVARRGELVEGEDVPANTKFTDIGQALDWVQRHTRDNPPIIIAPRSKPAQVIRRFVPNNTDQYWENPEKHRTAKPTMATLFLLDPGQKPEVHYVWDISDCPDAPVSRIRDAARSLSALGWGIDMAFADADRADEARLQSLKGIRWYPQKGAWRNEGMLRAPTYDDETGECTLCDLRSCHSKFITRIEHGKPLKTVDKPKIFDRVLYTSTERPIGRPYAVFKLLDPNGDAIRYPHASLIYVTRMLRQTAIERMRADPPSWIEDPDNWVGRVVHGKRDKSSPQKHRQFSYVPLPSVGHEHADAMIRNVMIIAPLGMECELAYLAGRLSGELLNSAGGPPTGDTQPLLSESIELELFKPPHGKFIERCYLATADTWQTVTPIILPENDEHKPKMTVKLIQRALKQSGIDTPCEFAWQSIPFFKNTLSAHKPDIGGRRASYFRPPYLAGNSAVHMRIRFGRRKVAGDLQSEWKPAVVTGPVVIGAGRHCGFGLFAAAAT
jgi:CRISPR-associated protein Csb2